MPLRIFENDPDAAPRQRTSDTVGRFRSGQVLNGRPMSLQAWRVTTGDPDVADAIHDLLGGEEPRSWDTESGESLEVITDAASIRVLLEGPSSIRSEMVLWGRQAKIRSCDGVEQLGTSPDDPDKGRPCICPSTWRERKEAAAAGKGCEPSVQVYFRLADLPDLGGFKFFSGSWTLARDIPGVEAKLATLGEGPIPATLSLVKVEMSNGNTFTKPVVTL
jgi:hypothetical protein